MGVVVGERCSSEKNQTNLGKETHEFGEGISLPFSLSLSHVTHTHNASSADAGAARLGQFTRTTTTTITTKSTWKKSICVLECVFYHTHACIILDLIRCY